MSTFINLLEVVYPVGSYYITTSSISPAASFGGTWNCVNDSFYPETLKSTTSKTSLRNDLEYALSYTRNGIEFVSAASYGQKTLPSNDDYFIVKTFTGEKVPAIVMVPAATPLGGEWNKISSAWCGASSSNKPQNFSLYTKATGVNYWALSAAYPLSYSSLTKSYIWKRTA